MGPAGRIDCVLCTKLGGGSQWGAGLIDCVSNAMHLHLLCSSSDPVTVSNFATTPMSYFCVCTFCKPSQRLDPFSFPSSCLIFFTFFLSALCFCLSPSTTERFVFWFPEALIKALRRGARRHMGRERERGRERVKKRQGSQCAH